MSWAKRAKAELMAGRTTKVKPHGRSMEPIVKSGALVTLEPTTVEDLKVGDVALVRVKGRDYLHLVKAKRANQVLIGNNRGGTNGWTTTVYGKATEINNG